MSRFGRGVSALIKRIEALEKNRGLGSIAEAQKLYVTQGIMPDDPHVREAVLKLCRAAEAALSTIPGPPVDASRPGNGKVDHHKNSQQEKLK